MFDVNTHTNQLERAHRCKAKHLIQAQIYEISKAKSSVFPIIFTQISHLCTLGPTLLLRRFIRPATPVAPAVPAAPLPGRLYRRPPQTAPAIATRVLRRGTVAKLRVAACGGERQRTSAIRRLRLARLHRSRSLSQKIIFSPLPKEVPKDKPPQKPPQIGAKFHRSPKIATQTAPQTEAPKESGKNHPQTAPHRQCPKNRSKKRSKAPPKETTP